MTARLARLLPALTILVVGGSLLGRIVIRGRYYPGWDAILPARGLFLASTRTPQEALTWALTRVGPGRGQDAGDCLSAPLNSLPHALLPGYLGRLWPWEYWGHTVTFLLALASLWLIVKAAGLPLRKGWIVLLASGASPTLLSFSLAAYPYAPAFLPHALALWVTLDRRFERRLLLTLFLSLLAIGLSWQLYDTARTVFLVFLGAAILRQDARWLARALWLVLGGLQLWAAMKWPGPVALMFTPSSSNIPALLSALVTVGDYIYVTQYVDLPVLFTAALLSFLLLRRDRFLVLCLLVAQIGFVVLIALKGADMVRPRRFLMVDSYCLLAIARMYAESAERVRSTPRRALAKHLLVLLLAAGNIWQVLGLVRFAGKPRGDVFFSMPYTESQADYMVPRARVDWAADMASRVEAGEKLIVIYGLGSYGENATNPTGVLDRMYLRLGHERFVDSVFVFGDYPYASCCLPIRPLSAVQDVLDKIGPRGPIPPETVAVYYTQDLFTTYQHIAEPESAEVFGAVRRRFALTLESPPDAELFRFRITPLPSGATEGFTIEAGDGTYELLKNGALEQRSFQWTGLPLEQYWVVDEPPPSRYLLQRPWGGQGFTVRLRGRLHVSLGGNFELLLGSDEQAAVSIARNVALTNPGAGRFRLAQGELVLAPGSYAFEVAYSDKHDTAHLVVDLYRAADAISRERPVVPAPSSQPAMPAGAPPARSMSGHASVPP